MTVQACMMLALGGVLLVEHTDDRFSTLGAAVLVLVAGLEFGAQLERAFGTKR